MIQRRSDPALLVLVSLAEGPKHGHALIKDIAAFSSVQLGPGTLYAAIDRLELNKLIEPLEPDGRRRPYRLTAAGLGMLRSELEAAEIIAATARNRLALP